MSRAEAAARILGMKPNDVRKLSDDETALLLADLNRIGAPLPRWVSANMEARKFLSTARVWATILATASMDAAPAPIQRPKREPPPGPPTRTQRLARVTDSAKCGITATEANAFLASLPQYGE